MTLYRDVLKQAWEITWRHKILWIFGFLASFWGVGSTYEIIYKSLRLQEQKTVFGVNLWQQMANEGVSWQNVWQVIINSPSAILSLLIIAVVSIVVLLLFYWLFTCGEIALIKGVDILETKSQDFQNLFDKSKKYFWPTFGLNLIGKILTFLLLFLLSYPILEPLLTGEFSLANFLLFLIIFVVVFLVVLIVAILMVYAAIYIILKEQKLGQAIKSSFQLFINNWLVSVETAFLLFLVSLAVGLAFIIVSTIAFIPFILLFKLAMLLSSVVAFWLLVIVALLLVLITFVLAASLMTTFQLSLWITLFEKLETGKAVSKLQRFAEGTFNK